MLAASRYISCILELAKRSVNAPSAMVPLGRVKGRGSRLAVAREGEEALSLLVVAAALALAAGDARPAWM